MEHISEKTIFLGFYSVYVYLVIKNEFLLFLTGQQGKIIDK